MILILERLCWKSNTLSQMLMEFEDEAFGMEA